MALATQTRRVVITGAGEAPAEPLPVTSRGWFYWPMLLLLGYLLFAHGCHGDDDHELFIRLRSIPGAHLGPK